MVVPAGLSQGNAWGEKGYFRIRRGADEARFESFPGCYGGYYADPILPAEGPSIICKNGGMVSADGKSCVCKFGTSGTTCDVCTACQNGGSRSGCATACTCSPSYFGTLCQSQYRFTETNLTVRYDPVNASDTELYKPVRGDYIVLLDSRAHVCEASSVFSAVGGVGGESARKRFACGAYDKALPFSSNLCAGSLAVNFSPPQASTSGHWTVCLLKYLGVNEFGADKGYAADGVALATAAASSLAPTGLPTHVPTYAPDYSKSIRKVGVYMDGKDVDTSGEGTNIVASTRAVVSRRKLNTTVSTFLKVSDALPTDGSPAVYDALIVPELERGDLETSAHDRTSLRTFVERGATVVVCGDARGAGVKFVNEVFEKRWAFRAQMSGTAKKVTNISLFDSAPSSLEPLNAVYSLSDLNMNSSDIMCAWVHSLSAMPRPFADSLALYWVANNTIDAPSS